MNDDRAPGRLPTRRPEVGRTARAVAILLAGVVLLLSLGVTVPTLLPSSSGGETAPTAAPGGGRPVSVSASASGELVLALVPSPERGNAPLWVNVSVSVSGGTPPYGLSVCFTVYDHSWNSPACAANVTGWPGTTPLEFAHFYGVPGNFSVLGVASDAAGSEVGSTALVVVTSGSALSAVASESVTGGEAPLSVAFNEVLSGGTPPASIQWVFGDGNVGSALSGESVTHIYRDPGTFYPRLIVTDAAGHLLSQPLAGITVVAGSASPVGEFGPVPPASVWLPLLSLVLVVAAAGAVGIRFIQVERWRREGSSIVQELEAGPPEATRRPPPP